MREDKVAKKKAYLKLWQAQNRDKLLQYQKQYYADNKENLLKKKRDSYKETPEKYRESSSRCNRKARQQQRLKLIEMFGGKCARCGFDDYRALQLDHIHGKGQAHRRQYQRMDAYYRDAMLIGTDEFQLLCANCNSIKRYENGEGYGERKPNPA